MFMQGAELLEEAGLMQYEISNFARMGFQCRHNLGYWEGEDYIGFGPSATSTVSGRRWTNPSSHAAWERQVTAGGMPAIETLDPVTRVLELIMLRLRTARGMRVKAYRELTGRNFFKDHQKLIHALHRNGLIRIRDGYLRLTRNGMLVSDSILAALFDASRAQLMAAPEVAPEAEALS
jgi:oxygen-independent coproporphyrinogen-3 oxidase